ncbi:MAG TPA: hypothetical protein VGQ02_00275 [Candidatus Limnocylindrales bacterium]|nr:hypothetical protein [Candidatus Limnocylindrales bacterium]
MLQLKLADDVTEPPDAVHVRPQVLIGLDKTLVVQPDAASRDGQTIRVRDPSRGDEECVDLQLAACVFAGKLEHGVAVLHTDSIDVCRESDVEPPPEDIGTPLGNVFVLIVEDSRAADDERDVRAERAEEMPELGGDEPPPRIVSRRGCSPICIMSSEVWKRTAFRPAIRGTDGRVPAAITIRSADSRRS